MKLVGQGTGSNSFLLKEVEYRLHLTPAPDDQEQYHHDEEPPFQGCAIDIW